MGWPLLLDCAAFRRRWPSFPQRFDLAAQARDLLGQLEHRFVLLRDVSLQVRDLLFEVSNAFVHVRRAELLCWP